MLKRTSQLIVEQMEALKVDAPEQLARNCACQRMLSHKVRRGRHKVRRGRLVLPHQENEQRGRTAQFVFLEIKVSQVDELAEFGGDRPCQRKRGRF